MAGTVSLSYSSDGRLATIQLGSDEERAITLDAARLESFVAALEKVRSSGAKGLLLRSPTLDSFCVGADISLIQSVSDPRIGAELATAGQHAFNLLADLQCRTVAAISGPCVGGGCEMVLACKYRVISDHKGSSIGLPETKLGILPGFGGTYRLPRLVGLPKALDIILAGKTLRGSQALKAGLVDELVATEKLIQSAQEIALGVRTPKRASIPTRDRILSATPPGRYLIQKLAGKTVHAQTKGFYPAPLAALRVTVGGLGLGRDEGLRIEAEELGKLIVTPESKALVHIYYLTEASKGLGKLGRAFVENVHALIVGAGTMGAGIASAIARAGHQVIVRDTSEEALKRGKDHVTKELSKLRYLSSFERAATANRIDWITAATPTEARTTIVIEAVFENMELKKKIFDELSPRVRPDCILASNTSSLSITEIAKAVDRSDRVVGMHFFNPVEKMPLVEIIRGEKTSEDTISQVAAIATKLGKYPIVVKDVPGFLVNRILIPYLNEAMFLLEEGHPASTIDEAAIAFGMPMGPVRLLDEVGLDVAAHVSTVMTSGYGKRMAPPLFAEKLLGLGRKGKKSGAGFYDHAGREWTPWKGLSEALGLPRSPTAPLSPTAIQERLIYHLVNEAMKCLHEGVAGDDPETAKKQIDLGTVMGIGFPPFRGGVIYYAEGFGFEKIRGRLEEFQKVYGERYAPFEF